MCMRACKNVLYGRKDSQNGGDEEDRTPDPLLARQVLSQLSYTPIMCAASQLNECGKFDEVRIFFLSAVYVGTQG